MAVERYHRQDASSARKKHLADCVVDMLAAVSTLPRPEACDIDHIKLAVCFLCEGKAGATPAKCLSAAVCPFHLNELR